METNYCSKAKEEEEEEDNEKTFDNLLINLNEQWLEWSAERACNEQCNSHETKTMYLIRFYTCEFDDILNVNKLNIINCDVCYVSSTFSALYTYLR